MKNKVKNNPVRGKTVVVSQGERKKDRLYEMGS
jgi:hypothetical protein